MDASPKRVAYTFLLALTLTIMAYLATHGGLPSWAGPIKSVLELAQTPAYVIAGVVGNTHRPNEAIQYGAFFFYSWLAICSIFVIARAFVRRSGASEDVSD